MARMSTRPARSHDGSSRSHDHSSGRVITDDARATPDPLSTVLQDLRLTGASYCRTELAAPWGLAIPPEDGAVLHVVIDGSAWLEPAVGEPIALAAGDVVLLPQGAGHRLVDRPGSPARAIHTLARAPVGEHSYELHNAGDGPRALLVCCGIAFESPLLHPLLRLMPEVLHVPCGRCHDPALAPLLDAMADEVRAQRIGAATVMARLADIVVARVVRAWVEAHGDTAGWLAAIRDPQVGGALAAFHASPERAWSVEALARAAGLSRSQFSERFTAVLGLAPARYVATWRMQLALRWLTRERLSIGELAARLGYDSEAAFSRAFKRIIGKPPAELRIMKT